MHRSERDQSGTFFGRPLIVHTVINMLCQCGQSDSHRQATEQREEDIEIVLGETGINESRARVITRTSGIVDCSLIINS